MNIVFLGRMNECGVKLCNYLSLTEYVVALSSDKPVFETDFDIYSDINQLGSIIVDKSIDKIIYFEDTEDDLREISKLLFELPKYFAGELFYIREKSPFRKRKDTAPIGSLICEKLVNEFKKSATLIEVSNLYGDYTVPVLLQDSIQKAIKNNDFSLPGSPEESCDFLHIDDFCTAIKSILINEANSKVVQVQSGYPIKTNVFASIIKNEYKHATVTYGTTQNECGYIPYHSADWEPSHSFADDAPLLIKHICENDLSSKKDKKSKIIRLICQVALFAVAFLFVEIYIHFLSSSSNIQYVDLRLLLIVVSTIIYGKWFGMTAAALCSVSSVIQGLMSGIKWYVLFYNIDNWIPLTVYFVAAVGIGLYLEKIKRKEIDI